MDIITTARHFEMTPEVRTHARKRLERLRKYAGRIDEVHVVLAAEKYRQIAEITLHARGTEIVSREESDDMLTSIDRVVERAERQLVRLRGRRREVRRAGQALEPVAEAEPGEGPEVGLDDETAEAAAEATDEESYPPVVVRSDEAHPDPITVEQAIDIMKREGRTFLLFKNARSSKVAMVHLRKDGNFGLVEAP